MQADLTYNGFFKDVKVCRDEAIRESVTRREDSAVVAACGGHVNDFFFYFFFLGLPGNEVWAAEYNFVIDRYDGREWENTNVEQCGVKVKQKTDFGFHLGL